MRSRIPASGISPTAWQAGRRRTPGVAARLASPFDSRRRALLYIAPGLGDQPAEGDQERFDAELREVLSVTCGRTLVLFTSYGQLKKSAETVRREQPDLTVIRQGEAPVFWLIEELKELPASALMVTSSFLQGVGIPGDAMQGVVIAEQPFSGPDDPPAEARMERLRNPCLEYQMPQAVLLFRQGVGRPSRTRAGDNARADCGGGICADDF